MQNEQEKRKPKMVIMCGLPKSGKSTLVNRGFRDYQVICGDDIRLALGVVFDPRLEEFVWGTFNTMVRASLIRGLDVVLDGTHTTKLRRGRVIKLGQEYNADIKVFFINAPYKICLERAEKDNFPISVLERMKVNLDAEPPSEDEGAEVIELNADNVGAFDVITELAKL